MAKSTPERIGKYKVTGVLGRGGMGLVYRAFDQNLGREVAIKTLTEGFAGDAEMLERLYEEAKKTSKLKHPNIVTIYDLGEQDSFPYIVMEYVAGDALDHVIRATPPLPLVAKLRMIEQVCSALGYAHRNDVIHRDVKPGNVILQPDGVVKLLDFGIARQEKSDRGLTRTGNVIGTLHYMAPERLRNHAFDGRSDVFSTGVLLYQLITGQLPFTGEDVAVIQKVLHENYPPLGNYIHSYPRELDAILDRALAKEAQDRYTTADEMGADISSVAEGLKKGQAAEIFEQAQQLVRHEDFTKAREVLLKVAKLDSQHLGARQLMVLVQQNIAQRQRASQIQQLRAQADDAWLDKKFDEAISFMEQALKLDPSSTQLTEAVAQLRQRKATNQEIEGYLRQADGACQEADFDLAQAVIAKALQLDKDDSRVRAANAALVRQVEDAARLAKTRKLLESARNEVGARHFTAAIELLTEAERIDPSNPELFSLLDTAKAGQDQERRRRIVERLQSEIAIAISADEVKHAMLLVDEALEKIPNEPALLQFKRQLERQAQEHETRRVVDEAVQKCRAMMEQSPEGALQLARDMVRKIPGNERLQVLQGSIEQHLHRVTTEEARQRYMTLANQALDQKHYREAVRLLEACQAQGAFSDEMIGLLDFARHEAHREQRASQIESTLNQAQGLLAKQAYTEAIQLLEPAVQQTDDLALQELLERSRAQQHSLQQKANAISDALAAYLREEQFDEGIEFLKSQPETVLQQAATQEALNTLRSARDRDRRALSTIAMAYSALDQQGIAMRWNSLRDGVPEGGESPFLQHVAQSFDARRKATANQALAVANEQAQEALAGGDARSAVKMLDSAATLAEFGRLELQTEWKRLRKEASRSSILTRIGLKGPRTGAG
jgi:serine/threonine-protein kinase